MTDYMIENRREDILYKSSEVDLSLVAMLIKKF